MRSNNRNSKSKLRRAAAHLSGRSARVLYLLGGCTVVLGASIFGLGKLEASVDQRLLERYSPRVAFEDLPPELTNLATVDLERSLTPLLSVPWTEESLTARFVGALEETGWVSFVKAVRRTSDGRFVVRCRYRVPAALIPLGTDHLFVDREGVRLPGKYRYDPGWKFLQGVARPAPQPGKSWEGDDVRAGLAVIEALAAEPFAGQITGVLLENFGGRRDRWRTHIELATDQPGGRIRWGSAPGSELEENSPAQKIAILRENFRRTGRADANYPIVDVSTFPDRFTIPG